MRKIEIWMKKGAPVLANGDKGVITKMQVNTGLGYVYYINVRLEGEKSSRVYHPADIKQSDHVPTPLPSKYVKVKKAKAAKPAKKKTEPSYPF